MIHPYELLCFGPFRDFRPFFPFFFVQVKSSQVILNSRAPLPFHPLTPSRDFLFKPKSQIQVPVRIPHRSSFLDSPFSEKHPARQDGR